MSIHWSKSKLDEAKKEISTLELSIEKTENTKFYAELLSQYIPLSKDLIAGFILLSINEWNKNHPGLDFPIEARGSNAVKVAAEMNEILKRRLKAMIRDESQHHLVDDAIIRTLKKFSELGARGVPK
ncbi:MAG: hypothetical protein ACFFAO_18445 [Candidatus Hermodarchaeota archaeon]